MTIGIIGLGLIGGSIAKECRRAGHRVIGADASDKHRAQAVDFEVVDEVMSVEDLIAASDVIGLCIPVDIIAQSIVDRRQLFLICLKGRKISYAKKG